MGPFKNAITLPLRPSPTSRVRRPRRSSYGTIFPLCTVPMMGDKMETEKDAISAAAGMIRKAAVAAARWAGARRRRALERITSLTADDKGQLPRRRDRTGRGAARAARDGSQRLPRRVTNVLRALELAVPSSAGAPLRPFACWPSSANRPFLGFQPSYGTG